MSFTKLFPSGEHSKNLGQFAALVTLATTDGEIQEAEKKLLIRFSRKLDITEEEREKVLKNPSAFPVKPENSAEIRLERMLDLFKVIFADYEMDEEEQALIERYAIALGFTEPLAQKLIRKSVRIFTGGLDLEDYRYLLNRK